MKKLIRSNQFWAVVLPGGVLIFLFKLDFGKVVHFWGTLFTPFALAFGLSYFLLPIKKKLEKALSASKFSWVRSRSHQMAATLTYTEFILFALVLVLFIGPILLSSIKEIARQLPGYLTDLSHWMTNITNKGWAAKLHVTDWLSQLSLQEVLRPYTGQISTKTVQGVAHLGSGIFSLITGLVLLAYVLSEHKQMSRIYHKLLRTCCTPKQHLTILRYSREANRIFTSFFYGSVLVSLIIGVLAAAIFSIMGLRYSVLMGLIVLISNLIPYFGPVIGAIPVALLALGSGGLSKALWAVAVILLLQQLDNNFLSPKIVGKSVGISGFWMIFVLLAGGGLFGFWGILLGVPCAACIRSIILDLFENI